LLCKKCWHDNPDKNRYCGMCGTPLEPQAEPAKETPPPPATRPVVASPPPTAQPVVASRSSSTLPCLDRAATTPPSKASSRSTLSGPSFLGLNDEPTSGSSYLLDGEEEGGHWGLLIASVLLVVAAVAGYYFRAELSAQAAPLSAWVMERVNPHPPAPKPPPAAPVAANPTAPATESGSANAGSDTQSAATSPSPTAEEKAPAADVKSAEPAQPAPEAAESPAPKTKSQEPAKYARTSRPKPAAEAAQDDPTLKLAQKYLRGQGVRQDCTTGMAYLREAMKRPSAAAYSQMGALYATGTCVPLDRVAAYRWFSTALQMAPSNPWLARERDELYGQMSSAERRQADTQ